MLYRVTGIRVPYDRDSRAHLQRVIADGFRVDNADIIKVSVLRRSIDARQKPAHIIYSANVETAVPIDGATLAADESERDVLTCQTGTERLEDPPVVVGAGPAGLFAGWVLAQQGYAPLILDRGGTVAERNRAISTFHTQRTPDPECNVLYGLGGAGTFSDGKLSTNITHPLVHHVLRILVSCGAPESILVDARPHVGTDLLQGVIDMMGASIQKMGGQIKTGVTVTGLHQRQGQLTGVQTTLGRIDTPVSVFATGHSARDTWEMLSRHDIQLAPKPFQLGVRVEHPQRFIDRLQFGGGAGHAALGAAEYKISTRVEGIPVFSFCMCPGGITIPTVNEPGHLCMNGMSYHKRAGEFASSGVVCTLSPEQFHGTDLASCLAFVRGIEQTAFARGGHSYAAPAQTLEGMQRRRRDRRLPRSSYPLGVTPVALDAVLPQQVYAPIVKSLSRFNRMLPGYVHRYSLAMAPESRASSPIRVERDSRTRQSVSLAGFFPVGEGAGYAGGIVSAAVDGMKSAMALMSRYAPRR